MTLLETRPAAAISAVNVVSRLTGFVRVVATGAALGVVALGDTYQSASVVSNVLFELLAGGLLGAVLVPAFVGLAAGGDGDGVRRLASVLSGRAVVLLGLVVAAGVAASPLLARALFAGAPDATRADQVALATVLLWFVLPQVVLYALGAVVTASLHATHRFVAAAAAPIANNVAVIVTMVAFAALHSTRRGLALTTAEQVVLGGGTLLGTVAMTAVVLATARRAGLLARPRWHDPSLDPLGPLVRQGAWGAGHIGLSQVLILITVVLANRVSGGAIAFTIALTLLLLPHAVVAHPVITTLSPRLAALAHGGDDERFGAELGAGLRLLVVLLLPSAALAATLARPGLAVVHGVGALDGRGLALIGTAFIGLVTALPGYSTSFLLTRAAYATGDARGPTLVNLGVTVGAVTAMAAVSALVEGSRTLVGLGLVHGVAHTVGALVLLDRRRRSGGAGAQVAGVGAATARGAAAGLLGAAGAGLVAGAVGWDDRVAAAVASGAGVAVGAATVVALLWVVHAPELAAITARRGGLRMSAAPAEQP